MRRTLRLRAAGLGFAALYEVLALASALTGGAAAIGWWLALSGVLTAAMALLAVRIIERPHPGEDDGGEGGEDPPPDEPPPWWPEFERDFRAHVSRRRSPV